MNIKKRRLHNFANLSLFMNSLTYLIYIALMTSNPYLWLNDMLEKL